MRWAVSCWPLTIGREKAKANAKAKANTKAARNPQLKQTFSI